MNKLKGFLVLLLCNTAGNLFILLTGLKFPGAVVGMVLLLVLLMTGRVKLATVEPAASLLISLLMLFILPGAVNMMGVFDLFAGIISQLVVILFATTLLALVSSAFVTEKLIALKGRKREGAGKS